MLSEPLKGLSCGECARVLDMESRQRKEGKMLSAHKAFDGHSQLCPVQRCLIVLLLTVSATVPAAGYVKQGDPAAASADALSAGAAGSLNQHMIYLPTVCRSAASNVNRTRTGRMPADEIWRGDLLITGDVEIPPGVTLTIEPGSTIRFTAQSDDQHEPDEYDPEDPSTYPATMISILVRGLLQAQGTPQQPITFTTDSDEPGELDWQSIMLEERGTAILDHVVIEHGHFGLQLNTDEVQASITHSTIRDATTCCICTDRHGITGPIVIADNQFVGCGREAIDTYANQNIIVQHNVFADNYVGIMSVGSSILVENNLFIGNSRGIGVIEHGTPTITGNEFTENDDAAIFVTDGAPLLTENNIHANGWNLQLEGSVLGVTAENNWWGYTDPQVIGQMIWDGNDDPSLGLVDFEPYAWEPFDLDVPQYP
jgi:hypothetical protein